MPTSIKCPNCAAELDVENMLSADVEEKLKRHYTQQLQQAHSKLDAEKLRLAQEQKKLEDQRRTNEDRFQTMLAQVKQKLEGELQKQLRKSIASDYDNELRLLRQNLQENEERIKTARQKEYEYLKKEQDLKNREQELELALQKKLMTERDVLLQQLRRDEAERNAVKETEHLLKVKELEKQLDDQRKLADEMKRKAEQGSMQLQGEVQELLLEELLRDRFPYDTIGEVGKGVEGADCIQIVRNHLGAECGKIIFESKRTKTFNNVWVEKLKTDMRNKGADVAVIVTSVLPKEMA